MAVAVAAMAALLVELALPAVLVAYLVAVAGPEEVCLVVLEARVLEQVALVALVVL